MASGASVNSVSFPALNYYSWNYFVNVQILCRLLHLILLVSLTHLETATGINLLAKLLFGASVTFADLEQKVWKTTKETFEFVKYGRYTPTLLVGRKFMFFFCPKLFLILELREI